MILRPAGAASVLTIGSPTRAAISPFKIADLAETQSQGQESPRLRRFDPKYRQELPTRLLDSFKGCVNNLSTLISIGYSFGDHHINSVIRGWIEVSRERRLEIVDPHAKKVPSLLLHVAPQVGVGNIEAREYFGSCAS
jgi:hypothetical protein